MPSKPPTHKPPRVSLPDGRPSASARGYGVEWRRLRLTILAQRPVCEHCDCQASEDIDHIVPLERGGTNEPNNLQALCHSCHSRKTAKYDGGFGRRR